MRKLAIAVLAAQLMGCEGDQQPEATAEEPPQQESTPTTNTEPTPGVDPLRKVFYGETHVHTSFSLDAYIGGTRITHDGAYRYAKGEAVSVNGEPYQRRRPLDFVAISDHAEYLGEMYSTMYEDAPGHDQVLLEQLRTLTDIEERQEWFLKYVVSSNRHLTLIYHR